MASISFNRNLAQTIFIPVLLLSLAQTISSQDAPQDYVDAHNAARTAVSVGGVTWNTTLEAYAQSYANQRISDCQLVHSGGPYGENLFWGYGASFSGQYAVEKWVAEKQYYNYSSNTCATGQVCGHYTQVVWANSVRVGCARVVCNSGAIFIICSYSPPGNYVGQRPLTLSSLECDSETPHNVPIIYDAKILFI